MIEAGAESGSGASSGEIIFEVNNQRSVGINWARRKAKVADLARNFEHQEKNIQSTWKKSLQESYRLCPRLEGNRILNVFLCLFAYLNMYR